MTPHESTVDSLLWAAELVTSLPGIPTPTIRVQGTALTVSFHVGPEHVRAFAVEAVAALAGLEPTQGVMGEPGHYGAHGEVGAMSLLVYAPGVQVVVPV